MLVVVAITLCMIPCTVWWPYLLVLFAWVVCWLPSCKCWSSLSTWHADNVKKNKSNNTCTSMSVPVPACCCLLPIACSNCLSLLIDHPIHFLTSATTSMHVADNCMRIPGTRYHCYQVGDTTRCVKKRWVCTTTSSWCMGPHHKPTNNLLSSPSSTWYCFAKMTLDWCHPYHTRVW